LLLSGGLDSRIVAGILKKLEPQLESAIACVTWGQLQSRDVTYARRIASWYDWEFFHVPYDAELVWSNIIAGSTWGGAEVAGIHLHGMNWFQSAKPTDLAIAASFGDSIGRAEFSSVHLLNLVPASIYNLAHLLLPSVARNALTIAELDRSTAWAEAETKWNWVRHELDMQENYMRRQLCHAMDYIRQYCCLHQAYTSEKLVSYMWSISPEFRTDDIYHQLLRELDPKLYSLPWARTGTAPDGSVETDTTLEKEFHEWGQWLRRELSPRLKPLVLSDGLQSLGIFSGIALRRIWNRFLAEPEDTFGDGESIAKLASIELARRHFDIRPFRRSHPWLDTGCESLHHVIRASSRVGSRLARTLSGASRHQLR
jgi:asparagine synthase (glutamine-hydrolysing)